ncbi:TonB-dependent receptor [Maricaulis sp.]|uniref:TonB-dependent receptor domain-containing protein n=1 Tax=Maricaulis sp. TaxID=1486257 RepID=UPI00260BC697|nr:TonB-dependent receptor [Maricaulis sp.]
MKSLLTGSTSALAILVGGLAVPGAALAQDDAQAAADETIVVTGSRIARDPNLVSPQPVQSVSEEDVTLSGDINIADVVNDLPALLGSNNTADNANAGVGVQGSATLDLRNLGTNRTLVLVDGRRHVSGQAGTAAVDVNTIPSALVQRVEVLTGGASAVYGADAVTGVVNFILKDDFEGTETRAQFGIADDGDAQNFTLQTTIGENFDNGRGNFTISFAAENSTGINIGSREHTRGDRAASDWPNPDLFIQQADIDQYGIDQILLGDTISDHCGGGSLPAGAESALCARIQGVPPRAIMDFPRFNLSSYGSLIGVDWLGFTFLATYPNDPNSGVNFGGDGVIFDFNNNGIDDCLETINGTQLQRFGGFAGCHVMRDPNAGAQVFQDGLIAGSQNAFGGDGTGSGRDLRSLTPNDQRFTVNFTTRYDVTPNHRWYLEAKFSASETVFNNSQGVNGFFDSWVIEWDNPYIPTNLRNAITTFVNDNPGYTTLEDVNILVGRDMTDLGRSLSTTDRQTVRLVTGFEGDIGTSAFSYDVYLNYGRSDIDSTQEGGLLIDRLYAAADAVVDPSTGNIVCRSEIDPGTPPIGSFLSSAGYWNGYNTFTPAQGDCVPMNIFGIGAPSQEAIDWVTATTHRSRTLEQTVLSGVIFGDSSDFFELPYGPIGVALGAEYREEESEFVPDPLESPDGAASTSSLIFPVNAPVNPVVGGFDVTELFGEISVPLLIGVPLAEELILEGAYRYSDYSTLGGAESWNVRGTWAPVDDLRFRSTLSQTVRAPNVNELFSPLTATTARPLDPCDAGNINDGSQFRAANCAADGIPAGFADPLTARVGGFTGGNPDLDVETADTLTVGFVLEPRFIPGLSITADYYSIEIEDGIAAVGLQEILEACYDAATFPNPFCDQFERDQNPASPTYLGLSNFTTGQLNFAAIETEGYDYQVAYTFDLADLSDSMASWGSMTFSALGNHIERLERREDPTDPSIVNDLLYEGGQPQDSYVLNARWDTDRWTLNWQASYWDEFLAFTPRIEIETAANFTNAWTGDLWRHDVSGTYQINDRMSFYGGVNNVFEEEPITGSISYPVGAVGRTFFIGFNVSTGPIRDRF